MHRYCLKFVILVAIVILSATFMHYSLNQSDQTIFTLLCSAPVVLPENETKEPVVVEEIVKLIVKSNKISCRDDGGEIVPWSIFYKLPQEPNSTNEYFREGLGYMYLGPGSDKWIISSKSINDRTSGLGLSMAELYNSMQGTDVTEAHVLYSDEAPGEGKNVERSPAKGLILANSESGIWITHSVPYFPPSGSRYDYPNGNGDRTKGEMFLCISLNLSQIDALNQVLQIIKPNVFSYFIPDTLSTSLPNLKEYLETEDTGETSKLFELRVNEINFLVFAKAPDTEQEIYVEWIAPTLKTSLFVQSTLGEADERLYSNCSETYYINNILTTKLGPVEFSNEQDNSKWVVSTDVENPWTCITDLNRMNDQFNKGGIAVCTPAQDIWTAFQNSASEIESCLDNNVSDEIRY